MNRLLKALFVTILFSLAGCDHSQSNSKNLNDKISQLEKNIIELRQQIYTINIKNESKAVAIFTPADKGFQIVNTGIGIFLISLLDIQQYANGYKVIFKIGNPNSIIYNDINVTILYGTGKKDTAGLDLLSATKYETTIYKDLLPAYWNEIEVVLSPAIKDQLNYIWIWIEPKVVKLHKAITDKQAQQNPSY